MKEFADFLGGQPPFDALDSDDMARLVSRVEVEYFAAGATVVSDRYYHSSLAYQGTGADRDWITMLNARARKPDLTIFLQVRPEVAAKRRADAGRVQELFEDLRMQEEVAAGYKATLSELMAQGERIETIDGEASPDAVFGVILALVGSP